MTIGSIVSLMRNGVFEIFILALPILGAALIVGLLVAVFQATTSIQEQTLTFVPKLVVILLMVALLGSSMFSSLRDYTLQIFAMIPEI